MSVQFQFSPAAAACLYFFDFFPILFLQPRRQRQYQASPRMKPRQHLDDMISSRMLEEETMVVVADMFNIKSTHSVSRVMYVQYVHNIMSLLLGSAIYFMRQIYSKGRFKVRISNKDFWLIYCEIAVLFSFFRF